MKILDDNLFSVVSLNSSAIIYFFYLAKTKYISVSGFSLKKKKKKKNRNGRSVKSFYFFKIFYMGFMIFCRFVGIFPHFSP